jgi:predicted kinase
MQKAIIGMGIPGAGKTTLLKKLAQEHHYTYVSPDVIRQELTGNEIDQTRNREVWDETYRQTYRAISRGETVVIDATFLNRDQRAEFIAFLRNHKVPKIDGVFIDAPPEVAKARNRERTRAVPEYVIDRMQEQLEAAPPTIEDGFDALFTFDEYQKLLISEREKDGEIQRKDWKLK